MYRHFFDMKKLPFVKDVPPDYLYESSAMSDSLGRLGYVADRKLFAVITGDAGCGKSTLLRKFAHSLPRDEYMVLYISDSRLSPRGLYQGMLYQLGIDPKYRRGDARVQLQKEVAILQGVYHKKVVCILDEAHLLERETLEEFRFLLNSEYDSVSPLAVVLSGQSELWDTKLKLQRYAAIRQRIDVNCYLPHMDRADTARYIQSHLDYAECTQQIFTDNAIEVIYKESTGILRLVNRLCERSLMYACQQGKRLIDDHIVRYIAENEGVN